jgi:hypothetical protein
VFEGFAVKFLVLTFSLFGGGNLNREEDFLFTGDLIWKILLVKLLERFGIFLRIMERLLFQE